MSKFTGNVVMILVLGLIVLDSIIPSTIGAVIAGGCWGWLSLDIARKLE